MHPTYIPFKWKKTINNKHNSCLGLSDYIHERNSLWLVWFGRPSPLLCQSLLCDPLWGSPRHFFSPRYSMSGIEGPGGYPCLGLMDADRASVDCANTRKVPLGRSQPYSQTDRPGRLCPFEWSSSAATCSLPAATKHGGWWIDSSSFSLITMLNRISFSDRSLKKAFVCMLA